ncbi:class I alpha-mannosidase 1A [Aspergillus undulatus]|uniref:class I alpha-mannosidase 1A n=1 Tax=Aspergillus undulatus TaxID=1810928 RepID=UPI003CCD8FC5
MFRPRRYRISLVFAAIFVLLILHFSRSRDQPPILQVSPSPIDHQTPPIPNQDPNNQFKNDNEDIKSPVRPPPYEQPEEQRPPQQQQQPPYKGSNDNSGQSVERPGSPNTSPSQGNDIGGSKPQAGAQTQSKHDEDEQDTSSVPHWKPTPEQHPIKPETLIKLPTGSSKSLPQLQAKVKDESATDKMQRLQQLDTIKSAFLHAWNGYKAEAMGHDEVKPLRGGFKDTFNGWGATLVDSLDTLWIMDLKQEFSMAVDYVKRIDFTTSTKREIPVFETAIRYLGGMLGAYDISGHKYDVLLEKSVELAEVLISAFDTPNRMPTLFYRWSSEYANELRRGDFKAVLAEIGSLSLEFTRLAQLTKDDKYYDAIARITNELEKYQDQTKLPGLWPLNLDASGCRKAPGYSRDAAAATAGVPVRGSKSSSETNSTSSESHYKRQLHEGAEPAFYDRGVSPGTSSLEPIDARTPPKHDCFDGLTDQISGIDKFGLGALGDSTYEYLPKEYMLLGGNNDQYSRMYKKAMTAVREHLLYRPMIKDDRDVRFLATVTLEKKIDAPPPARAIYAYEGTHLTCFAGGMFAIGSKLFGLEQDLKIGSQLTDGCVWAYEATKTRIMPEAFQLVPCAEGEPCEWDEDAWYKAMDPYADKRPKSHNKRSAEPEKGNWHVVATPESAPSTSKENTGKSTNAKEDTDPHRKGSGVVEGPATLTHEEFVAEKIQNDRLPPGMIGISARKYLLRPEAIESVFIMFRLTGDPYWREKGWKMFQAIDAATRTQLAHSTISDVTVEEPRPVDSMESFWLAETLKYFYLLFSDPSVVSLDEYVLNTEAHPFKRPEF